MTHITNKELILEAIRRTRYQETRADGTIAMGCRPSSVFHLLRGWMSTEEKRETFLQLVDDRTVVTGFWRYKRQRGPSVGSTLDKTYGQLRAFHPRAPEKSGLTRFATTVRGRFLNRRLGNIYLPAEINQYYEFVWRDMYIVEDGLPEDFPAESVAVWR